MRTEQQKDFLHKLRIAASEADDMLSSTDASDLLDCLAASRDYMFDAAFVIQQLEEQLAILKERFEFMHKDFRELVARNNAGEDLMACDYCRKNFGECSCNCMKDFEWFWNDEIEQEQNNDE